MQPGSTLGWLLKGILYLQDGPRDLLRTVIVSAIARIARIRRQVERLLELESQNRFGRDAHSLASRRNLADRACRSTCQRSNPCAFAAAGHRTEKRAK